MSDVFISYSRKDAEFVRRLYDALKIAGRDVWVDWEDIPLMADWRREIARGIEDANNFLFVISPDSVRSEVCIEELNHALAVGKRFVPILYRELLDAADQQALPAVITSHNWTYMREQDDFAAALTRLNEALDTDLDYVRQHTRLLKRALEWQEGRHNPSFLLRGDDLRAAETWLATAGGKKPAPTSQHTQYILASRQAATRRQRSVQVVTLIGLIGALMLTVIAINRSVAATNNANAAATNEARALLGEAAALTSEAQAVAAGETAVAAGETAVAAGATSERNADEARSLALASSAQLAQVNGDPDLALGLALQAVSLPNPPIEAQRVLAEVAYAPGTRRSFQHDGDVFAVDFSPDGRLIITAMKTNDVVLWDAVTGEQIRRMSGHRGETYTIAFHPDGQSVYSGAGNGEIIQWDINTGEILRRLTGHSGAVLSLAISANGQWMVSGDSTGGLLIWNIAAGEATTPRRIGDREDDGVIKAHDDRIWDVAFNPTGATVVSVGEDRRAALWDVTSGALVREYGTDEVRHNETIYSVAYSPDGRWLATGGRDNRIILWNANSGAPVRALLGHTALIYTLAFSPDGRTLLSGAWDSTVRLWDVASGALIQRYDGHTASVMGVAFNPAAPQIVSVSVDNTARLYDLGNGTELARYRISSDQATAVAYTPDGRYLLTGGTNTWIGVWNLETGTLEARLRGHSDAITDLAISPDGTRLVSTSTDNSAILWDLETRAPISTLITLSRDAVSTAFSPDGGLIAVGEATSGAIYLFDVASGQQIRTFVGHNDTIWSVAFSPDGRTLASGSLDRTARLWDVVSGREIRRFEGTRGWVNSVAFSPDGQILLTGASTELSLYNVFTGKRIAVYLGHADSIYRAVFSADGRTILTGSADGSLILYDAASGVVLRRFTGHTADVYDVALSPDGQTAASASWDGTARRWQLSQTLPELIAWTLQNRFVPPLSCAQRREFRVEPLCDEAGVPPETTVDPNIPVTITPTFTASPTPLLSPTPTLEEAHLRVAQIGENRGEILIGSFETWTFEGRAGQVLTISLLADHPADEVRTRAERNAQGLLDTLLYVFTPEGTLLASNDDIGGTPRRTDSQVIDLTLPVDGVYRIEARSYQDGTGGAYTLLIEAATP